MSHPISLTSEHLITSILLQRVQMGVPDGTSTDWREALIGCLWLSGRWSRVIILSLGGDMLTSYLAHFSPPLFSPFSHLFIALHLHIQLQLPPLFFLLICHFLVLNFQIRWIQATIVLQLTDSNDCWWLKHQCLARCCMIKTCKVNLGYIYVY